METLEDLERQLKRETTFEDSRKEIAALGEKRKNLKAQIKAKRFSRERPKTAGFFRGLIKAGAVAGREINKAAAEVQKRDRANKKGSKGKGSKGKQRRNLYGELMD